MPFQKDNPWQFLEKPEEQRLSKTLSLKVDPKTYTGIKKIKKWQKYLREDVLPQAIIQRKKADNFRYKLFLYYLNSENSKIWVSIITLELFEI